MFNKLHGAARALATLMAVSTLVATTAAQDARAGAFAAAATPSRFELEAKPGEVVSRTLEIQHVGAEPVEYVIRSADWELGEARGLEFFDALRPESCRPWLRLERRKLTLPARSRRKLRFEVHVPADAPVGECRFALLIESYDQTAIPLLKDSPISLPLTGRLGVIVYVTIGGARPRLEVQGIALGDADGERIPQLSVRNAGNAHGRLEGVLRGVDAAGREVFLPVSTLPVLAGQQRRLSLVPVTDLKSKKRPVVSYPLRVRGRLDWAFGHFDFDSEVR